MYRRALLSVTRPSRRLVNAYRYPNATMLLVRTQFVRQLHTTLMKCSATERTKVEETLKMLRDDLQHQESEAAAKKNLLVQKDQPKPSLLKRVGNELKHYYHGFRLLALDTRLSAKYMWRMGRGKALMRKERQQLVRTVSDLFRLVPFSIFVIVPFLEFTLPIFLKVFPNMLPSTFREASKEREKLRRQMKVKVEMAKFLQDTIAEIGLQKKGGAKDSEDKTESKALEFAGFIKKVRSEGGYVSNEELFKYSKLFQDELTLDNLSMSSLRALCRMLDIQPIGTPEILRFVLHMKLRELMADDKEIALEGGVDNLTVWELQNACRARGMRSFGMSEQRLKDQLKQWLELSLNDKVPPSLLLLSRTIYLPEDITFTDRLKALLSSLPEGIAEQTRQKLTELEGDKVDYKARLDLLKGIEKGIEDERKSVFEAKKIAKEKEQHKLEEEKAKVILAEKAAAAALAAAQAEAAAAPQTVPDLQKAAEAIVGPPIAPEMVIAAAQKAARPELVLNMATAPPPVHKKTANAVDQKDLKKIGEVIHGSAASEVKHDVDELKEKIDEHKEDLIEVDVLMKDLEEPTGAKRLRERVSMILDKVDSLSGKLENEYRNITETIADPAIKDSAAAKNVALRKVDDVLKELKSLVHVSDDQKRTDMEKVVRALDIDFDGIIDANIVLRALELLSKHKDLKINPEHIKTIVEVLKKEDEMAAVDDFIEGESPYPPTPPEPRVAQSETTPEVKPSTQLPIPPPEIPLESTIHPIPRSQSKSTTSFKETSV